MEFIRYVYQFTSCLQHPALTYLYLLCIEIKLSAHLEVVPMTWAILVPSLWLLPDRAFDLGQTGCLHLLPTVLISCLLGVGVHVSTEPAAVCTLELNGIVPWSFNVYLLHPPIDLGLRWGADNTSIRKSVCRVLLD